MLNCHMCNFCALHLSNAEINLLQSMSCIFSYSNPELGAWIFQFFFLIKKAIFYIFYGDFDWGLFILTHWCQGCKKYFKNRKLALTDFYSYTGLIL